MEENKSVQHVNPMTSAEIEVMPAAELRVLIAQDALALVNSGLLRPMPMTYLDKELSDGPFLPKKKQMTEVVDGWLQSPCAVCAIGAMMVAAIRRCNDITVGEYRDTLDNKRQLFFGYLCRFFTRDQLLLMECAFEGFGTSVEGDEFFWKLRDDPEVRMKAILENIIENNGVFTP